MPLATGEFIPLESTETVLRLQDAEELILAGKAAQACALLDSLIEADQGNAQALHLRAIAAIAGLALSSGIAFLRRALAISPNPQWLAELGSACLLAGSAADAIAPLKEAVQLRPNDRELPLLLARALIGAKRPLEAILLLESRAALTNEPRAIRLLGEALFAAGSLERALESLLRACSLDPACITGRQACKLAAMSLARYDIVVAQCRAVLHFSPQDPSAQSDLANALWLSGQMQECLELSKAARAAFPHDPWAHVSWLRAIDHTSFSALESRRAWEEWSRHSRQTAGPLQPFKTISWDATRPLRIGYLVDEIQKRPNSYFIPPLLASHDSLAFHSFCYLASPESEDAPESGDTWTALGSLTPNPRDVRAKNAQQIAENIRADRIDILVNLSWEFRNRHLDVFSHRGAPIQIEVPHYPATTGHPETDFLLTDKWICPPGCESMYSEKICRLDHSYMPWVPPALTPEVTAAPILSNGFCTFGFFQKPSKLNEQVWDAICEILRCAAHSRLLLHQSSGDIDLPDSPARTRITQQLEKRGVDSTRVTFAGPCDHERHFATVSQCDVALDSFPYNGTSTTCDCLWMGVPVVTLAGETHAGRVGLSLLSRLGLAEFAAASVAEYVATALRLARSPRWVSELRRGLRRRMQASPIVNARAVMSGIERGYRYIWEARCETERNTEPNQG